LPKGFERRKKSTTLTGAEEEHRSVLVLHNPAGHPEITSNKI
jgi:hypothetical protein